MEQQKQLKNLYWELINMLEEFVAKIEKEAMKYCDDYEIYAEKEKILALDIHNDTLNFAKEEINTGFSIRLIEDNKMGFAFSSDINKINYLAKDAYENLKANEVDENFAFAEKSNYPNIKNLYDKKADDLEIDDAVAISKTLIDTVVEESCQPSSGGFQAAKAETLIINSNGVECLDKSTGFGISIAVNAEKNGEKSTAYDGFYSTSFDLDPVKLSKDVSKLAMDSIGGESIETKNRDVLLDYHAVRGLLSTFIGAFNADNVLRGRSVFADKIGQEVTDSSLSFYDDATVDSGLASSKCDGEGVSSKRTPLVENGILKGFIFDIYTANKAGNTESTGNGMRNGFSSTPTVSNSNILLESNDEIAMPDIKDGIWVDNVLGAHTANPISGDFSVEVNNAFIIKNGEIIAPVKKAMLSGNIFESLNNCKVFKSEKRQYGSFIIPKLVFKDLKVLS